MIKGRVVKARDLKPGDLITGLGNTVAKIKLHDDRVVVTTKEGWPGFYLLDAPIRVERAS